jgi:uncharacterized membrane protein
MTNRAKIILVLFPIFSLCSLINYNVLAAEEVTLYTPYTKISVPPGESIDYTIDIKNNGSELKKVDVYISGLPRDWNSSLKAGGYNIKQISILPGQSKTLSLKVEVPLKVNKGNHRISVVASNYAVLPLIINVSEQGTFKTEFTSDQINMEGHSKSNFSFTTKLKNQTGEKQVYSLQAQPPIGWTVIFKPNYKQATAVEIDPNSTSNITIEVKPPYNIKAGTYKIPVQASNRSVLAELELEVVITGNYDLELTTPSGLLSSNITAGKEKRIELLVKNIGSTELNNIRFSASQPKNWDISFKPDTVLHLNAGENTRVFAIVKAYEKAIPGDYAANLTARTNEATSSASFRISVKTPMLWAWLGVLIIIGAIGSVYYLFRKYGRR